MRGVAVALAVLSLLASATGSVLAQPLADVDGLRSAAHESWRIGVAPAACADRAYRFIGARWKWPYRWSFAAATTPKSLSSAAVEAIRSGWQMT